MWIRCFKRKTRIGNNFFRRKFYSVLECLEQVLVERRWLCCRPMVSSSGEKWDRHTEIFGFNLLITWPSLQVCCQTYPKHVLWEESWILADSPLLMLMMHRNIHSDMTCWALQAAVYFGQDFFQCGPGFAWPVHFGIKIIWLHMLAHWIERSVLVTHFSFVFTVHITLVGFQSNADSLSMDAGEENVYCWGGGCGLHEFLHFQNLHFLFMGNLVLCVPGLFFVCIWNLLHMICRSFVDFKNNEEWDFTIQELCGCWGPLLSSG